MGVVVVVGKDIFANGTRGRRLPTPHHRRDIVSVSQADRMADLVHRRREPAAAVFTLPPIDRRVHHSQPAATDAADGTRRDVGGDGADVAGDDRQPLVSCLDKANAGIEAEEGEDLAGALLLLLGDRVVERVALRIGAIAVLEVVGKDGHPGGGIDVGIGHAVRFDPHRDIAVAGLVTGARLAGEVEVAGRRENRRVDSDRPRHRLPGQADRAKGGGARETGVVVGGGEGDGRPEGELVAATRRSAGSAAAGRGVVGSVADARDADVEHPRTGGDEGHRPGRSRGRRGAHGHLVAGSVEEADKRREGRVGRDQGRDRASRRRAHAIEIDVVGQFGAVAEERLNRVAVAGEQRTDVDRLGKEVVLVGRVADLDTVKPVGRHLPRLKRQHRGATDGIVGNVRRHLDGDIEPGDGVSVDEPVIAGILRRRLGERIIGVEVDNDLVGQLHERGTIPHGDRRRGRHRPRSGEGHDWRELAAAEIDPGAVGRGCSQFTAKHPRRADRGADLRREIGGRLPGEAHRAIAVCDLAVGVKLEGRLRAADRDLEEVAVAILRHVGAEGDELRAGHWLRHDRHHLGAEVEPEVELEGTAVTELFRRDARPLRHGLQPSCPGPRDLDPVGVVGERVRKADDDGVLVGEIVDGDATGDDDDVVAVTEDAIPPTDHRNAGGDRLRIDLRSRAEVERDLRGCLVLGAPLGDERADMSEGRHEVERHHLPSLKLLELLVGIGLPPPPDGPTHCPETARCEEIPNGGQPAGEEHARPRGKRLEMNQTGIGGRPANQKSGRGHDSRYGLGRGTTGA